MGYLILWLALLAATLEGKDKKILHGVAPQVDIPLQLVLSESAVIDSDKFYIADLARCLGSMQICSQVGAVLLGDTLAYGDQHILTKDQIIATIKEEFENISLKVNDIDSVKIKSHKIKANDDSLRVEIEKLLEEFEYMENRRLKLKQLHTPYDFLVWPGDISWKISGMEEIMETMDQAHRSRTRYIPLEVTAISKNEGRVSQSKAKIKAQFTIEEFVPTLKRIIATDKVLDEDDLVYRWLPLTPHTAQSIDEIVGKKLRRHFSIGKPIKVTDLKLPYIVKRGAMINILLHQGMLQIKSKGKVLQSARLGDQVTVALANSKKRVQARMVAADLAEVRP